MRARAVLGATLLTVALGGVASAGSNPVVAAAAKTERAGSAKVSFRGTVSSPTVSFTLRGGGLLSGKSARLWFRYPRSVLPRGTDPTGEIIVRTERGRVVAYLRMGALQSRLPRGKRWVRMDLSAQGKKLGIDIARLMGGSGFGAPDLAEVLRYAARTRRIGRETVLGRPTTRYRVVVDLMRAAERDPALAPSLQQLIQLMGSHTASMDAWVDGSGYLRRIRQAYSFFDPSSGPVRAATSIDYLDYGGFVFVAAPPPSQVVDASALGA